MRACRFAIVIFLTLSLLLSSFGCQSPQEKLEPKKLVYEYYRLCKKSDFEKAYDLISEKSPRPSRKKYLGVMKDLEKRFEIMAVAVKKVEVKGDRATVTVKVREKSLEDGYIFENISQIDLTKDSGVWRIKWPKEKL